MEAVGVIQRLDSETVAEIDEERQRRIAGSGRSLDDFPVRRNGVFARLGANLFQLAVLLGGFAFVTP